MRVIVFVHYLIAVVTFCLSLATFAATDYFAVVDGISQRKVYVFTYDTVASNFAYVTSTVITNTPNTPSSINATMGYGFIVGQTGSGQVKEGVERFVTSDRIAWTSDLRINLRDKTSTGEFYDTGVRVGQISTDPGTLGVAILNNEQIFIVDRRGQTGQRYYGLGSIANLTGDVSAIFPSDAVHLGMLADPKGDDPGQIHVTSTIAGNSDRFIATTHYSAGKVMVYNSNGTFKGYLTRLGTFSKHGIGNFKNATWGDLIIQLNGTRSDPAPVAFNTRWVDDVLWDTQVSATTLPNVKGTGTGIYFIDPRNIDGTESGRIIVFGETRGGGGDFYGVWIFESYDNGLTWSPTTSNPVNLKNITGTPANVTGTDIAALFAGHVNHGTLLMIQ